MTRGRDKASRPTYSSISMGTPVSAWKVEHLERGGAPGACEQFFSTSMGMGNWFWVPADDSVLVLDAGPTANLVCFRWLEHRNRLLEQHGFQRASAYPSKARFRFGYGLVGGVRYAADIPAGIAGNKGKLTAFALGADALALLWRAAMEALRGHLEFPRDSLVLLE